MGPHDVGRLQFVFGEGIQNYLNDSPVDVGVENDRVGDIRDRALRADAAAGVVERRGDYGDADKMSKRSSCSTNDIGIVWSIGWSY